MLVVRRIENGIGEEKNAEETEGADRYQLKLDIRLN